MFMNRNKFRDHVNTAFSMNNSLLKITSADRETDWNRE